LTLRALTLVPAIGLNASFAPGNARPGRLAFVTQSGALATAMLDWANSRQLGFSHFISLGDSADVDFGDMLDFLASDANTRAILMYAESVKSGRKFMSAARAAARNKPVIVVKAGRAPDGARAAASRTGARIGSDAVFDAVVRRAGMLRVDTLEALFDAAETLAYPRTWRGERLAILTNGRGVGALAADALAAGGGVLADLSAQTLAALGGCLPANWSHSNPVNLIGDAPAGGYQDNLQVLLNAPEVDALLFMHAPTAIVPAGDIATACLPMFQPPAKAVLATWLGGDAVANARAATTAAGIASYVTPERAVAAWLQCVQHARNQAALRQIPSAELEDLAPDWQIIDAVHKQALVDQVEWLGAAQTHALLHAYGIATLDIRMVKNEEEAAAVAQQMRSTSQAKAQRPDALELIVGITSDLVFGPVLLLGNGGTPDE
jgi:acetyltransferase